MSTRPIRPEPFRIEPMFVPRIWGSRSLTPLYPEKTNLPELIGEVWLTGVDCKIATGPFAGKTLGEAWSEMPAEWRGTRFTEPGDFPILAKFIFPNDKLSIQVHPDDAYAAAHEKAAGGRGKTEMWHVISAEPGARVLVGLRPGITREKFLASLEAKTLENLFVPYLVAAGDTLFLAAGTPHTIGPGMVLCEIQEYSDLTYRVYDYERVDARGKPRELHIEKALKVMNFGDSLNPLVKSQSLPSHDAGKVLLAACRFFATERWELERDVQTTGNPAQFEILIFLSGTGTLQSQGRQQDYGPGECWFVPASLGKLELKPKKGTAFLRAYVPDLKALRQWLSREGISEMKFASVLFG